MLGLAARNGRFLLVAGLMGGAGLPGLAAQLLPWVAPMIATLLFLNAFRTGGRILESLGPDLRRAVPVIALLQLALPLAVLGALSLTGQPLTPFWFAAILMMAAPSLTGAPNFLVMIGRDPTPAMQLLVVGTLAFPLTALAVLSALPGIEAAEAVSATLRLAATILSVVALGIALRRWTARRFDTTWLDRLGDDIAAVLLGVVVVGLMAEVGPLLRADLPRAALWIAAVMALNLCLQLGCFGISRLWGAGETVAASVMAGNRNIALFLVALPAEVLAPAMIFIGSYQIPMYLTPLILRRVYGARSSDTR